MLKLTRQLIESWGGPSVYASAEAAVKRGAVIKAELDGNVISGIYAQSPSNISCRFTVGADGLVESDCPCPKNRVRGQICEHVVALAISIMQRQNDPVRQQNYIEEQRRARRMEAGFASSIPRAAGGVPSELLVQLSNDWRRQFRAGGPVHVMCAFRVGNNPVEVLPEQLDRRRPLSLGLDDELALEVLEDMDETGVHANMALKRIDFLGLLDVMRGRRLYVSDGTMITVERQAAPLSVMMDLDRETGNLLLFPQIPESVAPEGSLPEFFAELEKSWALVKGRLVPLKPTLPIIYQGLYDGSIEIPREGILSFIDAEIPRLKSLVPFAYEPGADPDCFSSTPGTPRFHLVLHGSPTSMSARLNAVYGKTEVPAASPEIPGAVAEPDPDDFRHFLSRNLPAERRALANLAARGLRGETGAALGPVSGERKVINALAEIVPRLRRLGWRVDVEGRLGQFFESLDMVVPVVRVEDSHPGSPFEVSIDYELSSGVRIQTPQIFCALNKGENFLEIGNRRLLLDPDAIQSMQRVFADCESRQGSRPGSFRMAAVYAPYVQASLNALDGVDIEEPNAWRERAERCNRDLRLLPVPLGPLDDVLRPYQKDGVYWMRFLEESGLCGILADEMGLGKTLQTLAWLNLERVRESARGKPALIVAPTSLLENWRRECAKFTPWKKCLVMSGASRHGHWNDVAKSDIVVTSYALLRRDQEQYAQIEFSAAILDEAQHIKNRNTQNAIAAKQIQAQSRLVLTGTPVENGVADIWSIMDFLMQGYLGKYEAFRANYELPIASGDSAGEEAQMRLGKRLRPFLMRRLKRDVARDLPDKIQKVSFSELGPEQRKIYDALLHIFREKFQKLVAEKGFESCRMEVLAILLRLRQICCHLSLLPSEMLGQTPPDAPSGKMEQFFDLLDEAMDGGHRMLVFSQFVGMLRVLRRELDARGIRYSYIDGETKERVEECRRFNQDPSIPVFLISLKAGGTGLNLTGADMVVHFDPWWNPAVEDQATDRAHRIGQRRVVTAVKMIAENTVEEKVLELQKRKQAIIQATVGTADAAILKSLTIEDVKELLA